MIKLAYNSHQVNWYFFVFNPLTKVSPILNVVKNFTNNKRFLVSFWDSLYITLKGLWRFISMLCNTSTESRDIPNHQPPLYVVPYIPKCLFHYSFYSNSCFFLQGSSLKQPHFFKIVWYHVFLERLAFIKVKNDNTTCSLNIIVSAFLLPNLRKFSKYQSTFVS